MKNDRIASTALPLVTPEVSIHDAVAVIDRSGKAIAIVVDDRGRLIGTVTDGDVRRFMLANRSLSAPISTILAMKTGSLYPSPVKAPVGTDRETLLGLMKEHSIRHVPLVDPEGVVRGLVILDELLPVESTLKAVVMAGGYGSRLSPLTDNLPKPMLPIGGRPIMERIINQLRDAGIRHVNVATHYRPDKIRDHFGDGRQFGVDLHYINEELPLGTAGALGLMEAGDEPMLVINGDILTQVNFRDMLSFHREHAAVMTLAVRRYDVKVPYGVVECEGPYVRQLSEKPQLSFFVNAGIYLLEREACATIPPGTKFDMTDLIAALLAAGRNVASFPVREYWLDIGEHDQYQQAQLDYEAGGR